MGFFRSIPKQRLLATSISLFSLFQNTAFSATYRWEGNTSSDWDTNSNWNPTKVPGASDTASITTAGATPTISSSALTQIGVLELINSEVVVSGVGSLRINDSVKGPSGTVTIRNGGSVLMNGSAASEGNANYIFEGTGGAFSLLSGGKGVTLTGDSLFVSELGATSSLSFCPSSSSVGSINFVNAGDFIEIGQCESYSTLSLLGGNSYIAGTIYESNISGALEFNSTGSLLTLSGTNTYRGGTYFTLGTISVVSDSNLGDSSGKLSFNGGTLQTTSGFASSRNVHLETNGGTIEVASGTLILSGTIEKEGQLTKAGGGILVLAASNTYSGGTVFQEGITRISFDDNLGDSSGSLTFKGGTLEISDNAISSRSVFLREEGGTVSVESGGVWTLSGVVDGVGSLSKEGPGILRLRSSNSYRGGTYLVDGTIEVSSDSNLGDFTGSLYFDGGTLETFGVFSSSRAVEIRSSGGVIETNEGFITLSGNLIGVGALTKSGAGTLELSGSNSYHGGTTLSSGILQISSDSNLGAANGSLAFEGGALYTRGSFTSNRNVGLSIYGGIINVLDEGAWTLSGEVIGDGALLKEGSGTFILTSDNAYHGGTTLKEGVLQISSDSNLGDAAGAIFFEGGTLKTVGTFSSSREVQFEPENGTIYVDTGTLTLSGTLIDLGSLTKTGSGTLVISNASNTYQGGTILTEGTIKINLDGNLGDSAGALTFNGGILETVGTFNTSRTLTLLTGGGTVQVDSGDLTFFSAIEGEGAFTKTGDGNLILLALNSYSGATTLSAGALILNGGATVADSASFTISSGATFNITDTLLGATINNLCGAGEIVLGAETLTIAQSATGTFLGTIGGSGGMVKMGSSALILSGVNTYTGNTEVEQGSLFINGSIDSNVSVSAGAVVGGSGTVNGNVTVASSGILTHGSTFTITGDVDNFGIIELSDGPSEIIIGGNLTLGSGSDMRMYVAGTGSSLVSVAGIATIESDTTLQMRTRPSYSLLRDQFVLLSASDIVGTFSTVTSNNLLLEPSVTYVGGDLVATFGPADLNVLIDQANARAVGQALVATLISGNPALDEIFISLNSLDQSQLTSALNSMQPALFKGLAISQENNAVKMQDSLGLRFQQELDEMHCFSFKEKAKEASCHKEKKSVNVWTNGSYDILRQKSTTYATSPQIGYQTKTGAVSLGVDGNFAKYFYLGALGGYSSSNVDYREGQGSGSIDTGYGGLYFSAISKLFYANLSVIGGFSHYDAKRDIVYTGVDEVAKNNHGGSQVLSHLDTGINFGVSGISIRPFDSFDYICQTEQGFTETGAGIYNLKVKKSNAILIRNELGLQLASCFCVQSSKWTLSPKISWVREVRVKGSEYQANFVNTEETFTVTGYFPDRSLVSPGVMLTGVMWKDHLTMDLYYNGEFGEKYSDHNFGGQIRFGF